MSEEDCCAGVTVVLRPYDLWAVTKVFRLEVEVVVVSGRVVAIQEVEGSVPMDFWGCYDSRSWKGTGVG